MASGDFNFFYYSGPHGDSKYLRIGNILDAAKVNGMLINISEVLSWLYRIYVFVICLILQEMLLNRSRSDINREHLLYF